nr:MAG TPA: hypothetical protein [Caudoviricetes sp.]
MVSHGYRDIGKASYAFVWSLTTIIGETTKREVKHNLGST